MRGYYVDSCIYLNLWKKEADESGNLLWKFAEEFFKKAEDDNSTIYYSGFLLKELMFVLETKDYIEILELFNSSLKFVRVNLTKEEYEYAQELKNSDTSNISFFDILHVLFTRKTNSILITRDKSLIGFAGKLNVKAKKPEEIL